MRVSCEQCGRTYEVNDRFAGRRVKLPCKRCGHVTRLRLPASTSSPRPVDEAGAALAGTASPDLSECDAAFADLISLQEEGIEEAAPISLSSPVEPAGPGLKVRPQPPAEVLPPPVLSRTPPPVTPIGRTPPPPGPGATAPPEPPQTTPRIPSVGSDGAGAPSAARSRWTMPALLGAGALAMAGVTAWYLARPSDGSRPAPARQAGLPSSPASPPPASPGGTEPFQPPTTSPGAAPAAEQARGDRQLEIPRPVEPARPASTAAAPARAAQPVERRPPAPRPAPRPEVAAPSILLAPEPAPIPGRVGMVPSPPSGAEPQVAAAAPPRPTQPPRTDEQIQATLAQHARDFEACVAEARQAEPDLVASPRPVVITMVVRPNGRVTYPTLDDAALSQSALGGCLKRQASAMAFSEAGGEPTRVRLPLVLGP